MPARHVQLAALLNVQLVLEETKAMEFHVSMFSLGMNIGAGIGTSFIIFMIGYNAGRVVINRIWPDKVEN